MLLDGIRVSSSAPITGGEEVEPIVKEPGITTNQTQNGDNIDTNIAANSNNNDSAIGNNNIHKPNPVN